MANRLLWAVFIGTALVLGGSVGTWYFGNKVEELTPYRQPIQTATATVEVVIESSGDVNTTYMDQGGYLALGRGTEPILTTAATQCSARQIGGNRVLFRGVFVMDAHDDAAGRPLTFLRQAQFAQISFVPMPAEAHVLEGTAVLTINGIVRLEIKIPEQRTTNRLIFIRDLVNTLS